MTNDRSSPDIVDLAHRIETNKRSWLPIAGHVVNVTFTLEEADLVSKVLRAALTPDAQTTAEVCIICANGNDLPDGEYCRACGREGSAIGLRAAVIKARGRQEPPTVPVHFGDAQTQQHLAQGHTNPGMSGKPGEKVDYSPDIPEGK